MSLIRRRRLALSVAVLFLAACGDKQEAKVAITTAPVERRDIVIDAEATGVVEPINVIEVKSKASGQIAQMTVETGTEVRAGDLLVAVETRDVKNQYDQVAAEVQAARANLAVADAQRKRNDELFKARVVTAQEYEATQLQYANAQSQLVRARTNLDLAQQRLDDATVRAPVAGTIIEKTVSLGQVITSATGNASGGTTLLKMADLGQVRVRALVNESDIGSIRAGLTARVVVDAYPDRPFSGTVEKIEPQAVVQQSVTMFPVLVSLDNRDGLLKPGMNGEVSVLIDRRANVIAVPNDAIRSPREAAAVAAMLGLNPDTVQAQLRAQQSQGGNRGGAGAGPAGGAPAGGATGVSRGEVELAEEQPPAGARRQRPDSARRGQRVMGDSTQRGQRAGGDSGAWRGRRGAGARTAGGAQGARGDQGGGQPETGAPQMRGEFPGTGAPRARTRPGLVFVAVNGGYEPRAVRLGAANYDFTEVVSGLKEGEQVALLAAAAMQAQREAATDRMRGMAGGGGLTRQQPAGGAPGGGGPGGGGAPGGGGPRGGGGGGGPRP